MNRARPLRFLAMVLVLWIGARAYLLSKPGTPERSVATTASADAMPQPASRLAGAQLSPPLVIARPAASPCCHKNQLPSETGATRTSPLARSASLEMPLPSSPALHPTPTRTGDNDAAHPAPVRAPLTLWSLATPPAPRSASRWSGSGWLLAREGNGGALAPGGTLGGSQAGARLLYRLRSRFSLSGRAYLPLRRTAEAEIAAGVDWQPSARLPVHLLAERRQDIGGAGRSAFALTIYGGTSGRLPAGLVGEAYGQAGIVGTRSRDPFVDATARVSAPIGQVELGASAWGAAQPGAARLDAGPHLSYRLPVRKADLRVQADYRFRIAGDAAPGSGPALTLAVDF